MKGKGNFTFQPADNKDYVVILKKSRLWWLWLLLLIAIILLLLLPFKRDISFQTFDNNRHILPNTTVHLKYHETKLIDFQNFGFFKKKVYEFEKKSDTNGLVVFEKLPYTLFDRIFFAGKTVYAYAFKDCFFADSIMPEFYKLKLKTPYPINLAYRTIDYDFKVIDIDDEQPLPNAHISGYAVSASGDTVYYDTYTDPAGMAVLKNFPYCGKAFLTATAPGFDKDTIADDARYLYGDIDSLRTFRLSGLKAVLKFKVKDLKTKQPLPNAKATLIINGKEIQTVYTNINGVGLSVGEAEFKDVPYFSEFTILAQKQYYSDTTLTDSVLHFISLPDSERVIYLRPLSKPLVFKNIDYKTKRPLPGVRNEIYVNGKKFATEYSNSNGIFTVYGVKPSDKITIKAYKNNYLPNDYTVRDDKVSVLAKSQNKRTIPLKPKTTPPPPPPPPRPTPPPIPPDKIKPCEEPQESGGYGVTVNVHSIGNKQTFNIHWDMYSIPDRLIVYCGAGSDKRKIYDTQNPVSKKGSATFRCNKHYITVKIIGPNEGTKWWYKIDCK